MSGGKAAPEVAPVKGASAASAQVSGATLRPGAPAIEVLNRGAGEPVLLPRAISGVGAAALAQMRAGQLSAEAAYQSGALSMAEVLKLLEQTSEWGALWWGDDVELRRSLGVLVARHAPEKLEGASLDALPLAVRLWMGEALANAGDARAVTVLGSVRDELRGRAPLATIREAAAAFLASERLAWFYRDSDQHEKEVQSWLGLPVLLAETPLQKSTNWMLPDALIGAARGYNALGQDEKARGLYAQIPQYGHGWFTGLALNDQASALVSKGKHKEARQLLDTPLKDQGDEQIRIALLSLQALSYYKTGELEAASRSAQQVVEQVSSVKLRSGMGLEATVNVAQAILNWGARWAENPIVAEPTELRVVLPIPFTSNDKVTRRVFIRSLRDVPLIVTADDPHIKVHFAEDKRETDYFVQKEIVVEVSPQDQGKSRDVNLMVSSPQFPAYQAQIPIHIEVPKPIQLSASSVFFGEVDANKATMKSLVLSSTTPFRIVDVTTDSPMLEVQSPAKQPAKEQIITLLFTSPQVGRFYSGTIRIQTDMPKEEVVEIPYAVRVE